MIYCFAVPRNRVPRNRYEQYRLQKKIMEILLNQIKHGMEPYWFITYHYRDNKTKEDEIILDVKDIKNKLRRIIYQNRDTSIIGAGKFQYPRMVFINERSRIGTNQFHTHMIIERMPIKINTQDTVENLFKRQLPARALSMSKWKRLDVQRISTDDSDLYRLARYLSKQNCLNTLTLDPFNSDL